MKSIYIICLFFYSLNFYSQADVTVHWLINEDSVPECSLIKSGKFLTEISCDEYIPGYSIEIRGDSVTELVDDGQYFMNSKIEFTSDCTYVLTVIESNIPGNQSIGSKVYVEVVGTAKVDNLVMIQTKYNGEEQVFVLKKIED